MINKIEKLRILTKLNAIASNESFVTNYLKGELKAEVSSDRLGSVVAKKGTGKNILVTAPIDEIGMIVTQVSQSGMISFQSVGPLNPKNAVNQLFSVTTKSNTFLASLAAKPIMMQSKEELNKVDDLKSMYLDAGFTSDKQVFESGIQIGDMITRFSPLNKLENNRYMGKALESRSCVFVLSELMNHVNALNVTLNGAFTVQHKMLMKGAKTSSYMIEPELALSLDTVEVGGNQSDGSLNLGMGPVIFFYDQGLIAHPNLRKYLIKLCQKNSIPYQEGYQFNGLTEGHYLQLSKLGAATVSVGIPLRNKNSHQEIVDMNDLENTYKLLKVFVESLNDKIVEEILYS